MSDINNENLKDDLLETIDEWAPNLWHELFMGKATLRQIEDALDKEFLRRGL